MTSLLILSAAAVTMLTGAVLAQGPVGTWSLKMSFGEREIESELVITGDRAGALAGKWRGRRGESALSKVKFADGKLAFVRKMRMRDKDMEMSFEGEIDGDKLTGVMSSDFGEADITGTRQAVVAKDAAAKKDKPEVSPLIGTWEVTMSSDQGDRDGKMVVNADLSASIETERGKRSIKKMKLDGNKVSYEMVIERQDQEFVLEFAGKLDGNKMTGTFSVGDFGDVADVTAVKVAPKKKSEKTETAKPVNKKAAKPETALVGTWDITSQSDFGERKAELIIGKDLTAKYETERGEMKVSKLELAEGKLTYTLTMAFGENEFVLEFVGKLDGDKLEGVYEMEGRGDVADVFGKKRK